MDQGHATLSSRLSIFASVNHSVLIVLGSDLHVNTVNVITAVVTTRVNTIILYDYVYWQRLGRLLYTIVLYFVCLQPEYTHNRR